jgi:diacylglycerol kinase (ATP)
MTTQDNRSLDEMVGKTGGARILAAFDNSLRGIKLACRDEAAFRQELFLGIFLFPAAIWLGQTPTQIALLLMSLLTVLIVELLNTGIESVVDRVGMEIHEMSGKAKDTASAAVLLSLLQVPVIWGLVAYEVLVS